MTEQANDIQPENKSDEKPLAFTKRGKILAVLGGIPCGPLGMAVSPAALCLINRFTIGGAKKTNRFLIWSLLGIPAFFTLWFIQISAILIFAAISCGDQKGCMEGGAGWEITPANSRLPKP